MCKITYWPTVLLYKENFHKLIKDTQVNISSFNARKNEIVQWFTIADLFIVSVRNLN